MDNYEPREEFWACTLTKSNASITFEPSDDKLEIRSACLGDKAKPGERNLIEVQTEDASQKSITCSLLSLKLGATEQVSCKFGFSTPTTISLKLGAGPVSLCGSRIFLEPFDDESDEEEDSEGAKLTKFNTKQNKTCASEDEGVAMSQEVVQPAKSKSKPAEPAAAVVEAVVAVVVPVEAAVVEPVVVEAKSAKKGKRALPVEAEAEPPKKKKAEEKPAVVEPVAQVEEKPAEIEPAAEAEVAVIEDDDSEADDEEEEDESDEEEMPLMIDGEAVEDEEDEDSEDDEDMEEMDSDDLDEDDEDDDDEDDEGEEDESDEEEEPVVPVKASKKSVVVLTNGTAKKTPAKAAPAAKVVPTKPTPAKAAPQPAKKAAPEKNKTPAKAPEKTPAKEEQPSKKGNKTPAGKVDKKAKDTQEKKTPAAEKKTPAAEKKTPGAGGEKKTTAELKALLMKSPNLPKKADKFKNLLKNNFRVTDDKAITELWEYVEKNKK